jgi:D-glycerate 3-kinase
LVALNGCQGSGKTTASDYLCASLIEEQDMNTVTLSLDDFYLTHSERRALAASVHPLLATRGVPGTHDMSLLRLTLEQLLDTHSNKPVAIPRFDKATDDRRPLSDWDRIDTPVQCVLLEGWCLGAKPESADTLAEPVNNLVRDEDPLVVWREYYNAFLSRHFVPLYPLFDQWIMLQAPSFDCVFNWRREQERKLAVSLSPEKSGNLMDDDALHRFIQHYERITHNCLDDLPHTVNHLFNLDKQRRVTAYSYQSQVTIRA